MLVLALAASGAVYAAPSQAAPSGPPEDSGTTVYEAFTFNPTISPAESAQAAAGVGATVARRSIALRRMADAGSPAAPPAPSTPEQEAEIAQVNFDRGVNYTVDSSLLATSARPSSGSARARAARKLPKFSYDYISVKECKKHFDAAINDPGWTKNHYAWCRIEGVGLQKFVVQNGVRTLRGQLTMRRMTRGEGSRGHRSATYRVFSYDIVTSLDWAGGVMMDTAIECSGWPTWDQCTMNGGQYTRVRTGSEQHATIAMSSAVKGSSGRDDKGIGVFNTWTNLYEAARVAGVGGYAQGMRCDSAHYLPKKRGCIFDRVEGRLTYNRKDKGVAAVAKHIYTAQHHPEDTYPKWKGKTVPSKLHRMYYDSKKAKANNRAAVKVCKEHWGKDYADGGTNQCDEFPFKSTREGAAKGDRRFSARVLNGKQNVEAGNRLGTWYDYDHILDGDVLHVAIK